jgi:hypothetical protein
MLVVAIFTVVLACVAWRQSRDARILQRAYLDVKFGGVRDSPEGELVGHVDFKNVGRLPAYKMRWLVRLTNSGSTWRPPKIKHHDLAGETVIPVGAVWPRGSNGMPHPQHAVGEVYLYVWGRATYADGWRRRRVDFCHRYPWKMRETPNGGGVTISAEHARYHEYGNTAT